MSSPAEATTSEHPSRASQVAAVVCVVLAALLTTPAAIAYWGQRTLNDTEQYVATVAPLVHEPQVREVIATRVTDVLERRLDVEATLNEVFQGVIDDRPRLETLVRPLAAAINGLIEREINALLASDEFAEIWVRVNTRAQQALHRILTGEATGAVQFEGDDIVLDLDEVITRVERQLADRGLTVVERIPVPETDRQIVLAQAPEVHKARTVYAVVNPVATWLFPAVGLLYLAAFVLARRRPRMALTIGILVAANALLLALLLSVGRQLFVDEAAGTEFAPASRVFFDTVVSFLRRGQQVMLALGVVVAVLGWFAGSSRYARATRTSVAGGLERAGAAVPEEHVERAGRWVAGNIGWLQVAVGVLGFVVLFWGNDVTMSRLWWSLALVLVLLVLLRLLVGAGRTSHPASPTTSPTGPGGATPGEVS